MTSTKRKTDSVTCPKYLPADNPARSLRDLTIIKERAKGQPLSAIADKTGITKQQVHNILSDDEAKAKLQLIINKHIAASDKIQDNIISIASTTPGENGSIRTADILAATKEHNQIIGIAGSHTQPNVFIGRYYQQTNVVAIDPGVLDVLQSVIDHGNDIEIPGQ